MKSRYQAAAAFGTSALIGMALRTRDCFTVDGSPRCLPIFHHPTIQFHPNNHLLYLVNVFLWTRLVGGLGFKISDPLSFVLAVDAMNVVAAAGCIAILYWITLKVTTSWRLATAICAGYGFTAAFLAHATAPNEPMVGALWSFLGIGFAVLFAGSKKIWPLIVSGLLFALAMATYRSMVLLAPAGAVVILLSAANSERVWKQLARLATFALAFLAGCAGIFGWAYARMGVSRGEMAAKFLRQEDAKAYFDPSMTQWLKLPLGLLRNCFPVVPYYYGMRGFLKGPKSELISAMALIVALFAGLTFCAHTLVKRRASLNAAEKTAISAALTGLVFTMVPLLTWNPNYGKFWIQPLACLAAIVAIAFRNFDELSRRTMIAGRIAGALFLAGVACNLGWALRYRSHQPFEFEEARKLTQIIGDKDLVVLDRGADSVSVIYAYLWADEKQLFPIMDRATTDGIRILGEIEESIQKTRAAGGKVYFVGVLDVPKPTWEAFLGRRCGVPYETFEPYRNAARVKATFTSRTGPTPLWELDASAGVKVPLARHGADPKS